MVPVARRVLPALAFLVLTVAAATPAGAQWTHRYPHVQGYGHQVYLEGYELPTLAAGPFDPAPSPVDGRIALAARGWIWLFDPGTGVARRLTHGPALDSRPAWSPDGTRLAFVRDDGRDLDVGVVDLRTGDVTMVVATPTIDMDPAFGPDGALWYTSGQDGTLDIWRHDFATGERARVTTAGGIELKPLPHPDGRRLVYLAKRGGPDRVVVRDLATGDERILHRGAILSQLRPALSPDGSRVVLNIPRGDGDSWELVLRSLEEDGGEILLVGAAGDRLPLAPAWSGDGTAVWFAEPGRDETMALWRVPAAGGRALRVPVTSWRTDEPTGRLRVVTRSRDEGATPVGARLHVTDGSGHPAIPTGGRAWFDGQNGRVFFYSPGAIELELPAGRATVVAARGLATPAARTTVTVAAGETREVELELTPVWDPGADGWLGGDHHFHLNYGGPWRLDPEDLVLPMAGEDLDVATPLVANLHNRFGEQGFWGFARGGGPPMIRFGQEVRSHFLGHMGLLGTRDLFWPWVWGPGYEVYGDDDRPNAVATAHAREQGGLATWVHPVMRPGPFEGDGARGLPVALVADGVLGYVDAIELVCLWSDELGSAEAWYRLLNVGRPVAITAGTDVMTDFYRTMAIGTTRVWVHTGPRQDFASYLEALRAGRSFATNGPLLDLRVEGARPGDAVPADGRADWSLEVHTAVPVERVEILVNGEVAWSTTMAGAPASEGWSGSLDLPVGGWIAARAVGPPTGGWPAMDSYAFGHTAPVWIGTVGSTEPGARRRAAAELLDALDGATQRLSAGYGDADIPVLEAHYAEARATLERMLGGG